MVDCKNWYGNFRWEKENCIFLRNISTSFYNSYLILLICKINSKKSVNLTKLYFIVLENIILAYNFTKCNNENLKLNGQRKMSKCKLLYNPKCLSVRPIETKGVNSIFSAHRR